jgi:hypothetical protein
MTTVKSSGFTQDLRGLIPESWACIDCGVKTAPGLKNRLQAEQAFAADWNNEGIEQTVDDWSEVYMVKPAVWRAAGMGDDKESWDKTGTMSGCLCIGCLEKRIGRTLVPKDFMRDHAFQELPGTKRLLSRRNNHAWTP